MLMNELNRLKDKSGIRDAEAARHLGCRASKINRIMLGQSRISAGDTKMLAELYGAPPALAEAMVDLARGLGRRGEGVGLLADLERHSTRIRQAANEIVPALLRTEAYQRALDLAGVMTDDTPRILTNVPEAHFVLSESCLRRAYANRETMHEQLDHILAAATRPNVQIQVLPFDRPAVHAGRNFELIDVEGPAPVAPLNVVHTDTETYIDNPTRLTHYDHLWEQTTKTALNPTRSTRFIKMIAAEHNH
jgi:hypothetical protein